jgi:hypothetical protein
MLSTGLRNPIAGRWGVFQGLVGRPENLCFLERRQPEVVRGMPLPRTPVDTSALAQRYVEGAPGS